MRMFHQPGNFQYIQMHCFEIIKKIRFQMARSLVTKARREKKLYEELNFLHQVRGHPVYASSAKSTYVFLTIETSQILTPADNTGRQEFFFYCDMYIVYIDIREVLAEVTRTE